MRTQVKILRSINTNELHRVTRFIRLMPRYRRWRVALFIRDKYKCVLCGQVGGWLEGDHHPIPLSVIIREFYIKTVADALQCRLLWDIDNGRTLCHDCHERTPTYGKSTKGYKIKYG